MKRGLRIGLYVGLVLAALLFAAGIAGVLTLRSDWFRDKLRERIVAEAERATGGSVELESFNFDWRTLRVEVRGFLLRGTEPSGARPLFSAGTIAVGLRIVSAMKRDIDLESLLVDRPEVNILVGADGRTNIPSPKTGSRRDPVEEILKLAIGSFEIRNGAVDFDSRRIPLHVSGRRLTARFVYEGATPRYRGEIAARELTMEVPGAPPTAVDVELRTALERNRVEISRLSVKLGRSDLTFSGTVENFKSPRTAGEVDAVLWIDDAASVVRLPVERQGQVRISGKASFQGPGAYAFAGKVEGKALSVRSHGVHVVADRVASGLRAEPDGLALDGLEVRALDGVFRGQARLAGYRVLTAEGTLAGIPIASAGRVHAETARIPWNGNVSGSVKLAADVSLSRVSNTRISADLRLAPVDGPRPLEGTLALSYDQAAGLLRFDDSRISTPQTKVEFSGALGERLQVDLRTADLDDVLRAGEAFSENFPVSLPVSIENGSGSFRGSVLGSLDDPRIAGHAALESFQYDNRVFQRLGADLEFTRTALRVRSLTVERDGARLEGRLETALSGWKPADASAIAGTMTLRGAELKSLVREVAGDLPLGGSLSADAQLAGTVSKPSLAARVEIGGFQVAGESFERAQGQLRYVPGKVEVSEARLESGRSRIDLKLAYEYAGDDIRSGKLRFEAAGADLSLASFAAAREFAPEIGGAMSAGASGALTLLKGVPRLTELNGKLSIREITYQKRAAGSLDVEVATKGAVLGVTAAGNCRGSRIRGSGEWRLEGDYPGSGSVEFSPAKFSELGALVRPDRTLPFSGVIEGQASVKGSLRKPEEMRGEVTIQTLELRPRPRVSNLPSAARDLSLRNAAPVVLSLDAKGVNVRNARFVGRDTSLEVLGIFSTRSRNAWNLEIRGGLDLALISSLYPELVTSGRASVNATVRGTVDQPLFGGRMELQNASVFLADVPSGIENANGMLFFDRNRATIERLTAQAGGGQLRLSGFVGVGGPELLYRLQAEAEKVRVRYPEGVSTTVTGSVSLTGTSTRSLLAGSAMIERSAFNPRMDIGSLLAQSVKPVTTPVTSNPVLTGMQFDIRVTSSPTLELQTSLAKNIQAEADLRLRGSAAKPIVLGRVTVNQGEIQFFGNKYTITRGDVSFYNPARIEPVLDLDLETRVRGVIVNLTFAGPMSKLNMSYRSDPPLQSQEIIALLAVGRAPGSNPTQAGIQNTYGQGGLPSGTDTLIGQAISTPISSRLQRFFGVSRLKIDPHLTGTEISPQARLTVEQQISRDITLTYVTNLSEAKEQLVRLEWDLNRQWSVVAVRDENGTFGIDFLYKKRFR